MRLIAVSVLSMFVVLPAMSAARLPVVNVSAAGVSARSAFGADSTSNKTYGTPVADLYGDVPVAPVAVAPVSKKVVARAATKNISQTSVNVDTGAQIASRGDILSPNRPSSDLWARSDTPLRVPSPDEFSVIRTDANLPEESLDSNTRTSNIAPRVAMVEKSTAMPMAELDAQIAKLTELQRRADESFNAGVTRVAANTAPRVASNVATSERQTARPVVGHVPSEKAATAPVKLSRLVVPADDGDVVMRAVEKNTSPRVAAVRNDMANLNPAELRRAFRKTFLSENKHLSTYPIDDRFDVASDMGTSIEGFTARRDLSESGGIRPLEIKIKFLNDDAALSRANYTLLTEYAGVVRSNPTRAIQVSIPQNATLNSDDRKLAARRLAIVEQVLRDTGVSEQRIMPVLSQRNEDAFVLRVISSDQYETMTQQQKNMFGDTVSKKTYKSMTW
ncbi:MAG: hypothetical protein NC311_04305 [Muribaculaceae bacterium]|nr:hypothetical protein [Muribaculaceae bacterium]